MKLITPMKWLSTGMALSCLLLSSCKQDSPNGKEEPQVPTPPVVTAGTTVTIEPSKENTISHSGYQIILPKGAVEEKTDIKVNTATEKDFQDPTYKALGDGIELSGNVSSLLSKGCEISFNNPNIPDGTEMYIALVYSTEEEGLRAIGDKAKHRVRILSKVVKQGAKTQVYLTPVIGEGLAIRDGIIEGLAIRDGIIRPLEIIGASKLNRMLVERQMPNMAEFGLKEVVLPSGTGKITLKDLSEITSKDKVLLFIHGWTSSPIACWSSFITGLDPLVKEAGYTKYLTMGYNTSMPIDKNGELLSLYLQNKLNGAKVDIVAHSMGGLVARSALENYGKADLVQNLITLGTPHKGSPMAIIKYGLETFSSAVLRDYGGLDEYGRFVIKMYNDGSQGFQDLYTESDFIKRLAKNEAPSTYYHPVAAIYSKGSLVGIGWLSRDAQALLARADGVVTQESAWGIPASENNGKGVVFMLPGKMPHVTLTESEEVIRHVSTVLRARAKVNPEGVVIENGVLVNTILSDDFNGSKLDLNKWNEPTYPSAVKVQDGILKMEQNSTDAKIELLSKHRYRATQRITMSRKVALYPASDNFFPYISLVFDNHKELIIEYSQHSYANKYGLYVMCFDEQTKKHLTNQKISNQVFNTWFSEKCEIDVARNELKYYRDNQLLGTIQLEGISLSVPFMVRMHPYGWYTGHKHYMDNFKLEVR